jgi:hypothetical protein
MLFLGGEFSHAVRKGPLLTRGEGIRQDRDSRGDLRPVEPAQAQRDVAQEVVDAVGELVPGAAPLLYARVDLVEAPGGRPVVLELELELTEPSLFLPQAPGRRRDSPGRCRPCSESRRRGGWSPGGGDP